MTTAQTIDLNIELYPKQEMMFHSSATEILFGGATRGGKSHGARMALIVWCLSIPNLQCVLIRKKFQDILDTLDDALAQLLKDEIPVLATLEKRVAEMCRMVSQTTPQTAKKVQPLMGKAIQKLDELAQDLQAHQERLKERA